MDNTLSRLVLSNEIKENIRTASQAPQKKRASVRFPKRTVMVAAALLALVMGVGMAAAAFMDYDRFIGRVGEDMRDLMQEVSAHTSDAGIRMDVLAAVHDGESIIAYIALTDEEGARIDENTEIHHVDYAGMPYGFAPMVDYDAETNSAIYRVEAQAYEWAQDPSREEGGDLISGTVTLNLHSILTGRQEYEPTDTGLTAADILTHSPQPILDEAGGELLSFGVSWGENELVANQMMDQLDTGAMPLLLRDANPLHTTWPTWETIGNAAVLDGFLHIQHQPVDEAASYAHTQFSLGWPGASADVYEQTLAVATVDRGQPNDDGMWYTPPEYRETILELPAAVPVEEIRLLAGGITYQQYISGNWSVTFAVEENPPTLQSSCQIDAGEYILHSITISSIGVRAEGTEKPNLPTEDVSVIGAGAIEVYLADGSLVGVNGSSVSVDDSGSISIKDSFSRPINLEQVARLVVDGQDIPLQGA